MQIMSRESLRREKMPSKLKNYMVRIKMEEDNPDPLQGQKGKIQLETIKAYSLEGAGPKALEKFGGVEVLEVSRLLGGTL